MQKRSAAQIKQLADNRRKVFALVSEIAAAHERCPTDRTLAARIGLSQSSFARCILALSRDGKISSEKVGPCRVITIMATGQKTAAHCKENAPKREQKAPRPPASKLVPEVANRAMMALRARGIVCYAERISEAKTDLTGDYVVGKEVITLEDLKARAERRIAA